MDLFNMDLEEAVDDGPRKRSKQPYKESVERPPTKAQVIASTDSLFEDLIEKPNLRELYISQQQLVGDVKDSNGYKMIGLFDGAGGSMTGFSWAGFEDLASVEFVKSARETLQANYPNSYIIEPEQVLKDALEIAAELDIPVIQAKDSLLDDETNMPTLSGVHLYRDQKNRGRIMQGTINWESTMLSLGGERGHQFRHALGKRVFNKFYVANQTMIWGDDIRGLDPEAMMGSMGLERGELDTLEGSPPCKSFSMSGIREDGWGKVLHYSDERNQRTDDLFLEFLRVLHAVYPKTFVAENVAGIGMGEADTQVMAPLMEGFDSMGYRVIAKVMNSEHYSVPQSRPRMIFIGVRKDMVDLETQNPTQPYWPMMHSAAYTVQDALDAAMEENTPEYLDHANCERFEIGKSWRNLQLGAAPANKAFQLMRCHPDRPAPTITATGAGNPGAAGAMHPHECRKFTIPEYRYLFGFPREYVFTGTLDQQGERMGRCVPPYFMKQIADTVREILDSSTALGVHTIQEV